jgi:hypothetical protein
MFKYFSRGEKTFMILASIAVALFLSYVAREQRKLEDYCHSQNLVYDSSDMSCVGVRNGNTVVIPLSR